ncbi:bacillithiol biosynthesis deacetylase BshB1 [Prosthecochloris sp. GSB1]|uniref:bacillithiol biosynthesis deacetylase BshB1 n=1 Tax=Prosthecochloris sp. GSB1 TaxID=281093 RepID=UPI000B8CAA47|nr:bacillithiol biosynthesis deacetylase BshB1 [Prosthecochloris sp. GSB1]ASQ90138.1 bacillithiol biosynthesis deacetylase BshB1 [Prosthecochloris sp. GSB1]
MVTEQETVYALAFGAHPDDVELSCGATLLKIMDEGRNVAVCDLTRGEMGTLGTQETREAEGSQAAKVMGYSERLRLDLGDSCIRSDRDALEQVISVIRRLRPRVVFTNPPDERHPDHAKASRLVSEAVFYAGLKKLSTNWEGTEQTPHRPAHLLHYMQYRHFEPSLIVDVSKTFERSRKGVLAFASQFYREGLTDRPETLIQRREFLSGLEARARYLGEQIGVLYGEGFSLPGPLGVSDFTAFFSEK